MSQFVRITIDAMKDVEPALFNSMIKSLKIKHRGKFTLNTKKHSIYVANAIGRKREDDVDCVLQENGNDLSIGFKIRGNGNILQIRGDFWDTGFDESTFGNIISHNYAIAKIKRNAKNNGQTLIKNKIKEDGTVVLRYAV